MALAHCTEDRNPLVVALCGAALDGIDLDVDGRDEMLRDLSSGEGEGGASGLAQYFSLGSQIWATLRQVVLWGFGDLSRVGKILDFASGYGRVNRFLVRDVPPERVWVADIYAEGVRFQEEHFGVHGLVSTLDPADFACAERFDCILVSSLFTHLPEATFVGWLGRLLGLLAPGGLLVFSVHDEGLLAKRRALPPSGLLFDPSSESGSLPGAQYGSTWVSEAFVRSALARLAPAASAQRIPKGLAHLQDLWVVVDRPGVDFSGLTLTGPPDGFLESCALSPTGRLELGGWVTDRPGGRPVQEVRVEIHGAVLARCRELTSRDDVARALGIAGPVQGWRLGFDLPSGVSRAETPLVLSVTEARGTESVLWATTVDAALLRSTRLDLLTARDQLAEALREKARLGEVERRLGWRIAVLESRLAAMEASWFWKLRKAWFGVKRALGLTRES